MTSQAAGAEPPPSTVSRWIAIPLRVSGIAIAVLVLSMPVFAGLFVTGDVAMLHAHHQVANVMSFVALFHIGWSVLLWRPGRRSSASLWTTVVFFVVVFGQYYSGLARQHYLHFPVGTALAVAAVAIAVVTWLGTRNHRERA